MMLRWTTLLVSLAGLQTALLARAEEAAKSTVEIAATSVDFKRDIQPILGQFCYDCHGEKRQKGDLSLQRYQDEAAIVKDRAVWERVLRNVRNRDMPPENKPQPSQTQRDQIAAWIESNIFHVDCNQPDPGRVTIRRLNRAEYNNTIRDLVGVEFRPADDFPADDSGYGFDNVGDALSLPPVLLEKYLNAAERILDDAMVTQDALKQRTHRLTGDKLEATTGTDSRSGTWTLVGREGELFVNFKFPAAGEYVLRTRVYGEQAGNEPVRIALRAGGKDLLTVEVPEEQDSPKIVEHRIQVPADRTRCAVAYLNNFRDPKNPDPKRRDRNLLVEYLELEGPFNPPPQPLPETHRRIFICQPATNAPLAEKSECARKVVSAFASRAFRRPVTEEESKRLASLTDLALKNGESFENSVKLTLQAVLVSPHFLFRGEWQPDPNNPKSVHAVDEFALASRISYFLWSSMPDAELFDLAGRGALRAQLDTQVTRMLKSPKARALVDNFAGQWLQLRNLELITPDRKLFPAFNDDLRKAMLAETEMLFETILREDRSVLDFLGADFTFVNERLARHYGLTNVTGGGFQRVSLEGQPRGGLLTHASILTLTSNPTRTSPVKRGKWILENILGTPPPPPPPDVPELKEGKQLTGTLRQRMEQHRENPLCAGCHARMDPIGFSFEHFDAIGAWREKDGEFAIDPSGKLASGEELRGPDDLRKILLTAKRADFIECLTRKLLTYALGRGLEYYDKCAIDQITSGLAKENYKFSALVTEIVKATPFQMRRGEAAHGD